MCLSLGVPLTGSSSSKSEVHTDGDQLRDRIRPTVERRPGVLWSQTPPALPAVENATTLEQEFDNGVAQVGRRLNRRLSQVHGKTNRIQLPVEMFIIFSQLVLRGIYHFWNIFFGVSLFFPGRSSKWRPGKTCPSQMRTLSQGGGPSIDGRTPF